MGELRWTLTYNDESVVLTNDPQGWQGLVLKHERDELYHGVFYYFTADLGFFCKGAGKEFVDAAYVDRGSEAEVTINVEYKCDGGFAQLFPGRLNMKSYRQDFIGKTLYSFVNVEKTGITYLLRNREETKVDLTSLTSLDGLLLNNYTNAPYDLIMHGRTLLLQSALENTSGDETEISVPTSAVTSIFHQPTLNVTLNELKQTIDVQGEWLYNASLSTFPSRPFHDTEGVVPDIWATDYDYTVVANGELVVTPITSPAQTHSLSAINLILRKGTELSTSVVINNQSFPGFASTNGTQIVTFNIAFSGTTTVQYGEKLWLIWNIFEYAVTAGSGFPEIVDFEFNYTEFTADIETDSVFPNSIAKAITIHEAWSRLCESVTGQTNFAFYSEFFGRENSQPIAYDSNGCGSFTAITNGENIRGFIKPMYHFIKDFFSSCNAVWNLGLGIETVNGQEVIRIEEKGHFYNDTVIFNAGEVSKATMRFKENLVFSNIKIGYVKWEIEYVNGLQEPMTRAEFNLPDIKSINNTLEQFSTYIAGMYAIEVTRRMDSINFPTEDYKYDNDNFFIALNRTIDANGNPSMLNVAEKDENFSNISNLYFPETAYNLRFQLRFLLARWMNMFTQGLTKLAPSLIKPTYTEGNPDCTTTSLTNCRSDAQGISIQNVQEFTYPDANFDSEPLFLPEEYEFDYPVSYDQYTQLISNPNGLVQWSDRGGTYTGYIKSMDYHLRTKMMHFVLIRKT